MSAHARRPRYDSAAQASRVATIVDAVAAASPPAGRKSAARRLAGAVGREAEPAQSVATTAQQRPPALPAPRLGAPDDLRKIKGIGAKTESALHDLGVYHYDQIANWTSAHIDWLEGRIAIKGRIRREQWVEQAILLMTATVPA
ncbi:hypothetical protein [Devosia lucknowensis]|nr:hypothetical protein [Devosia lucknowensis]